MIFKIIVFYCYRTMEELQSIFALYGQCSKCYESVPAYKAAVDAADASHKAAVLHNEKRRSSYARIHRDEFGYTFEDYCRNTDTSYWNTINAAHMELCKDSCRAVATATVVAAAKAAASTAAKYDCTPAGYRRSWDAFLELSSAKEKVVAGDDVSWTRYRDAHAVYKAANVTEDAVRAGSDAAHLAASIIALNVPVFSSETGTDFPPTVEAAESTVRAAAVTVRDAIVDAHSARIAAYANAATETDIAAADAMSVALTDEAAVASSDVMLAIRFQNCRFADRVRTAVIAAATAVRDDTSCTTASLHSVRVAVKAARKAAATVAIRIAGEAARKAIRYAYRVDFGSDRAADTFAATIDVKAVDFQEIVTGRARTAVAATVASPVDFQKIVAKEARVAAAAVRIAGGADDAVVTAIATDATARITADIGNRSCIMRKLEHDYDTKLWFFKRGMPFRDESAANLARAVFELEFEKAYVTAYAVLATDVEGYIQTLLRQYVKEK